MRTPTPAPTHLPSLGQPSASLVATTDGPPPAASNTRSRRRWAIVVLASVTALLVGVGGTAAYAATTFSDVPSGHPFASDIKWLTEQNIANGYQDGTFRPEAPVSRQSAASFLHKYNRQIQIVSKDTTFSGTTALSTFVACPSGKRPVAGGGTTTSGLLYLTDSNPSGSTWGVRWASPSGAASAGTATVFAACVPKD